jgi:hypothetical protein
MKLAYQIAAVILIAISVIGTPLAEDPLWLVPAMLGIIFWTATLDPYGSN